MKILAADDDRIALRMLVSALERWEYTVVSAGNGTEAWDALQQPDAPRLAILDWMMPGLDGIEICRRLRRVSDGQYVYVLLLTSRSEKDDIVEGLEAGADDFIIKPYHLMELRARLLSGQRILRLESELIVAKDKLQFQATHDGLTGLSNRTMIVDWLRRELDRAERDRTDVGVVMADIDHFKDVNDTYGHLAGDAVLREAARRMQGVLRLYDGIGRYGGEEFVVVLWRCGRNEALVVAERLRRVMEREPFAIEGASIPVTLSLGVSVSHNGNPRDPTELLRTADAALYVAKGAGRNRIELAPQLAEDRSQSDDTPVTSRPRV